jgi:hypothetical protein
MTETREITIDNKKDESLENRDLKWNFAMGLIHGIAFTGSRAFNNPNVILPLFLDHFEVPRILIGLFAAVMGHHGGGVFGGIPQLFVANRLENKKFKKPVLVFSTTIRTLSWLLIAIITFYLAGSRPGLMLWSLLFLLILYTFMGGISNGPLMDIWGKTIPSYMRGKFMGDRHFWGSLLALGTAYIAKKILVNDNILFPNNFSLLFLLASVTMGIGYIGLASVREPVEEVHEKRQPINSFMKRVLEIIQRDLNFKKYLIVQTLVESGALSFPFYVLYAVHTLHISPAIAGLLIFSQMAGEIASNLVWSFFCRQNR